MPVFKQLNASLIFYKQFDKNFHDNYFYANLMDICVLSRVGGFRLGKFVSILSNENKQMEVAFTHIHKRCT